MMQTMRTLSVLVLAALPAAALAQVGIQPPAAQQPSIFQRVGGFFG